MEVGSREQEYVQSLSKHWNMTMHGVYLDVGIDTYVRGDTENPLTRRSDGGE